MKALKSRKIKNILWGLALFLGVFLELFKGIIRIIDQDYLRGILEISYGLVFLIIAYAFITEDDEEEDLSEDGKIKERRTIILAFTIFSIVALGQVVYGLIDVISIQRHLLTLILDCVVSFAFISIVVKAVRGKL